MVRVNSVEKVLKKMEILKTAEKIILDNNQEMAVHDIAIAMGIAKGTIYNSFQSKDHLYLELLLLNEKRLLELAKVNNHDICESVSAYMLYHMNESNRTVLFHAIEDRITSSGQKLQRIFSELYKIRGEWIMELKELVSNHLERSNSNITMHDYLSYVWTLTYGASLLLSSTYFQRSIHDRTKLMDFYINRALLN